MKTAEHTNEELIKLSREGDKNAEDELIRQNSGLVRSIIPRFRDRGCEDEDLFQIGCIGMLRAARNYDFSLGNQFSTYAVPLIIGEIRRFLRDDGIIKVGRSKKVLGRKLLCAREEYIEQNGREPRLSELAQLLGTDICEAASALESASPVRSLSDSVGDESDATLEDFIKDSTNEIDRATERIALAEALSKLSPERRKLIFLRFFSDRSQSDTAGELGMTQVRVSREERRTLECLRELLSDGLS